MNLDKSQAPRGLCPPRCSMAILKSTNQTDHYSSQPCTRASLLQPAPPPCPPTHSQPPHQGSQKAALTHPSSCPVHLLCHQVLWCYVLNISLFRALRPESNPHLSIPFIVSAQSFLSHTPIQSVARVSALKMQIWPTPVTFLLKTYQWLPSPGAVFPHLFLFLILLL